MSLDIRSRIEPPSCFLAVAGEVDLATADSLREVISMQLARGNTRLDLDLGEVSFMDSTGVHLLTWAHGAAGAIGGSLLVSTVSPSVTRILRTVGASALLA